MLCAISKISLEHIFTEALIQCIRSHRGEQHVCCSADNYWIRWPGKQTRRGAPKLPLGEHL